MKIFNINQMAKNDNETRLAERLAIVESRLDSLSPIEELLSRIDDIDKTLPKKEVLTLEEASEYLGVSKSQLYKLTRTASIPHYKPNGKFIYFDRTELIEWVKQNPVKTKKEHEFDAVRYVATKPLKGI